MSTAATARKIGFVAIDMAVDIAAESIPAKPTANLVTAVRTTPPCKRLPRPVPITIPRPWNEPFSAPRSADPIPTPAFSAPETGFVPKASERLILSLAVSDRMAAWSPRVKLHIFVAASPIPFFSAVQPTPAIFSANWPAPITPCASALDRFHMALAALPPRRAMSINTFSPPATTDTNSRNPPATSAMTDPTAPKVTRKRLSFGCSFVNSRIWKTTVCRPSIRSFKTGISISPISIFSTSIIAPRRSASCPTVPAISEKASCVSPTSVFVR